MGKGKGSGGGNGSGKGCGKGDGSGEDYKGKTERLAVPAMPAPAAVICCVLNFLIPGLGTICAGFSAFCCSRNEDMTGGERFASCCISFGIGILQLLTTVLCLIGWVWSCIWGGFFIVTSAEYYHNNKIDVDEQRARVLAANTGVIVVTQPGAQVNTVIRQPIGPYGYPAMSGTAVYQNTYISQNYSQPGTYSQVAQPMQPEPNQAGQPAPSDKQLYSTQPPPYPPQ